jgi:RNA polymerase sigma-70 factor (ECF subfamily)
MWGSADFGGWYQTSYPRVVTTLTIAAGSVEVAEDVTAEAFVRAYERWDRVRRMASPDGWLYRVALNLLRRRGRRLALERDLLRRAEPPAASPEVMAPEVWDAVRSLTPRQRTAVALRYVLDLPEAEVAQVMGVAVGTASATLATARRRLEPLLVDGSEPVPHPDPSDPSDLEEACRG